MQQTSPQDASHACARQSHKAQNKATIPDITHRADSTSKSNARGTRGPAHTCADITASHAAHMHGARRARLSSPSLSPFPRANKSCTKQSTAEACGHGTRALFGILHFNPTRPWRRQARPPKSTRNLSCMSLSSERQGNCDTQGRASVRAQAHRGSQRFVRTPVRTVQSVRACGAGKGPPGQGSGLTRQRHGRSGSREVPGSTYRHMENAP